MRLALLAFLTWRETLRNGRAGLEVAQDVSVTQDFAGVERAPRAEVEGPHARLHHALQLEADLDRRLRDFAFVGRSLNASRSAPSSFRFGQALGAERPDAAGGLKSTS